MEVGIVSLYLSAYKEDICKVREGGLSLTKVHQLCSGVSSSLNWRDGNLRKML